MKQFKRMIKYTLSLQCKICTKFLSTELFYNHLQNCNGKHSKEVVHEI